MKMNNFASLDLNYILIESYKKLGITEEELAVILMINHLVEAGNKFITNQLLAIKMNFDENKLDDLLCSLIKKGFLEYADDGKGGLKSSLDPLNKLLYKEFELSVLGADLNKDHERREKISKLYKKFEKEFGRNLAPVETHRIDEWINNLNYTFEEVEYALKEAVVQNVLNIRYVDKILSTSKKRKDIKKEGYTFRTNDSQLNENVDDVIEILKTKWTNNAN